MPPSVLNTDLSTRSPGLVAEALSWYLHPLRAGLRDSKPELKLLPPPPDYRGLVFSNASKSTVLTDLEPMGPPIISQEPFLIEQKTRYDIERNLDFLVYKRYRNSVMIFLNEHDEALIRSKYHLKEIEVADFSLDEIAGERKRCSEAFSAYREKYELASRQAEQYMKDIVDDLVTPKFLELSQQVTGQFARQKDEMTEEIRTRTKEIPEMNRKLDDLIAKLKL